MIISVFIPGWARRSVARIIESVTPLNETVQTRWQRRPELENGAEVCLFVAFAPDSSLREHSLYHARAWAAAGFRVVLLLITDTYTAALEMDDLDFACGVLVRENRGYDFGAWASALEQLPEIRGASFLALANDSVYGPLNTFEPMLARARQMDADVIGGTESAEYVRHFQSFVLFFKPKALHSEAFWKFWRDVRAGGRTLAINRYELGLVETLERGGLRCEALFPARDSRNPTYRRWKQLIEGGFPYLKTSLLRRPRLRARLSGWQQLLHDRGYDPGIVERHIQGNTVADNASDAKAR